MTPSKQECRQFFRKLQSTFAPENYFSWNLALIPYLGEILAKVPTPSLVAAYRAMPHEANLSSIFSSGHRYCFPRSNADGTLDYFEVALPNNPNSFVKGRYGLNEPGPEAKRVDPSEIALLFVPMVAFDPGGYRLGQGKGYYDRFLANFKGQAVGVAFSWQEAAGHLPVEAHDQPLSTIVTELGVRRFQEASADKG